ncbi:MAG: hypothetical protein DLM60_09915 [Pseudonocardiales bacterium]|nr:MAG: hypothetical protein DLM60_09915 [Pseudonocardiales bacterium]
MAAAGVLGCDDAHGVAGHEDGRRRFLPDRAHRAQIVRVDGALGDLLQQRQRARWRCSPR